MEWRYIEHAKRKEIDKTIASRRREKNWKKWVKGKGQLTGDRKKVRNARLSTELPKDFSVSLGRREKKTIRIVRGDRWVVGVSINNCKSSKNNGGRV